MTLTAESILALAPDSSSAANGKKLATPAKWQNLNITDKLLWGQAQGSGVNPYLVGVDLNGLVSKCSCPSRKFPCKHALALMLLYASHASDFGQTEAPESLQTWLKGREQRAESKEKKAEGERQKEADPAAQAKRRAAREKKVTDGLAALDVFLKDLVRDGLAQANSRPYSDWDTQASRLVDAQAPGAARLVRQIPERLGDPAALLTHLARLHLLCEAWTRQDTLSEPEQADLRTALGFPLNQAEVLAQPGVVGEWYVAAQFREEEDNLTVRRTWLKNSDTKGDTDALILDFAAGGRPLPPGLPLGSSFQGEVCFAPSATPQRAVMKGEPLTRPNAHRELHGVTALDDVLAHHADLLSKNPWLERSGPYVLQDIRLAPDGENWRLVDGNGFTLPLPAGSAALALNILAQTGGQPFHAFGEFDGQTFNISGLFEVSSHKGQA